MAAQMTVGTKLVAGFSALLALLLLSSGAGLWSVSSLGVALETAVTRSAKRIDLVQAMGKRMQEVVASMRGAQLAYANSDAARAEADQKQLAAALARLDEQIAELRPLMTSGEDKLGLDSVEQGVGSLKTLSAQYLDLGRQRESGKADLLMNSVMVPLVKKLEKTEAALVARERALLADAVTAKTALVSRAWWLCGAVGLLALGVGAFVLLLVRKISGTLREIASDLREGAGQVATAAAQVSRSSQTQAQTASRQAASLEEASASSQEISSMTHRNAESSGTAATLMMGVDKRVEEANRALDQMTASMQEITTSSDKISKIIHVIDEIAFQTNILALNAAVEAARAGGAGMGFAVVAEEVRNLAQRSAQAARDTTSLIEDSIGRAKNGQQKLEQVAGSIRAITEGTGQVRALAEEVSQGSQEQTRGMDEIAKAVHLMEEMTQQGAASAEENAAAGQELSAQAEALRNVVARMTGLVGEAHVHACAA